MLNAATAFANSTVLGKYGDKCDLCGFHIHPQDDPYHAVATVDRKNEWFGMGFLCLFCGDRIDSIQKWLAENNMMPSDAKPYNVFMAYSMIHLPENYEKEAKLAGVDSDE